MKLALLALALLVTFSQANGQSARQIAQKVFPSVVVLVLETTDGRSESLGSGFFVRPDVVATNLHVIKNSVRGYAKIVGQEARYEIAGVVAEDQERDLVLLKIATVAAAPLPLGDTANVAVGDDIYVVGSPRGFEGTFSQGIVSGIRHVGSTRLFQITAPISKGSSGGPVLDRQGRVIGVAFAFIEQGQNLNFAVPSSYVIPLLANVRAAIPLARRSTIDEAHGQRHEPVERGATNKMVLVPAGPFWMGDDNESPDTRPRRAVYLRAFYIDKYEVVNDEFAAFIDARGYSRHELWHQDGWQWITTENAAAPRYWSDQRWNVVRRPVVGVSWYEADAYCRFVGKRLPTEAEWEKAARGPDGRLYPWGQSFDSSRANVRGNEPTAVGSHPLGVSPYGVHDMSGNVWEWVNDWYASSYYQTGPSRNPLGPATGDLKVRRGGSWLSFGSDASTLARSYGPPNGRTNSVGFRCASDAAR